MALQAIIGPTIKKGQSLSDGLDLTNGDLLRITMPLGWTEAPVSFQISSDGVLYNDVFRNDGFEWVVPVIVPRTAVIVPLDIGKAVAWLKIRSGTRSEPVPQEDDRVFAMSINTYQGQGPT